MKDPATQTRRRAPPHSTRSPGETTSMHNQSTAPVEASSPGIRARPRSEPALPHEADESSRSQASASPSHQAMGIQAHADACGPTQDTDRGPLLDEVYQRTLPPAGRTHGPVK